MLPHNIHQIHMKFQICVSFCAMLICAICLEPTGAETAVGLKKRTCQIEVHVLIFPLCLHMAHGSFPLVFILPFFSGHFSLRKVALVSHWIPTKSPCQGRRRPGELERHASGHFSVETEQETFSKSQHNQRMKNHCLAISSYLLLGLLLRFLPPPLPFPWCVQQSPLLHHLQSPPWNSHARWWGMKCNIDFLWQLER